MSLWDFLPDKEEPHQAEENTVEKE